MYGMIATDIEKQLAESDLDLVPGRLSVELAQKLPMTFVMTAENDTLLRDAIHVAKTLEKAGRLAGWCQTAQAGHASSFDVRIPEFKEFYEEWRLAIEGYTKL